jgi:NAD(P)H dehydrogenase (quinone)
MKIGIIVHSQTGNTYAVGQKILENLQAAGHTVTLERLKFTGGDQPGLKSVQLETPPKVDAYEALVFGAPVHAFALSRGMEGYLSQIPSLQGKKVACFVTKGLRFHWAGGTQAISKMKMICTSKGAQVCATGIVVWNEQREQQIAGLIKAFSPCF